MTKDPYKILGVSKTANDKEIKKAYRQLAKKWHPDKNPGDKKAAEKFKEISAAYTLLADKELRARYDSGEIDASGQQQHPFGGGFGQGGTYRTSAGTEIDPDLSDLFSSLFGMRMGGMGGRARQTGGFGQAGFGGNPYGRAPAQKGGDIQFSLDISLPEAIKGTVKQVQLADGSRLKIKIPEGTKDGAKLRLRGKGGPGINGGPNGDARVKISVKPHKFMRMDGKNLRMDVPISLKEAVLGGKITVPTPKGNVSLKIKPGTNSGQTLRLKGKGVKGGDLLVRLMIYLPEKLGEDLKSCVKEWPDTPNLRDKLKF